ncbi:hypothetical protein DAI22_11g145401 [Oryza sativa Japonica Group]|nr:hypothetical protein DAI22_11g145401 [Oryza sativa Japonica Group]
MAGAKLPSSFVTRRVASLAPHPIPHCCAAQFLHASLHLGERGTKLGFRLPRTPPPPHRANRPDPRFAAAAAAMGTERKRKVSREPLRRGRQDLRLRQARRRRHHQRHRRRRGGQPAPNRRGTSSPKTLEKRRTLPVWQQKDDFLAVLHDNQALILVGETGSGKHSDGIAPQYLDPQIHRSAAIGSGEWHSGRPLIELS